MGDQVGCLDDLVIIVHPPLALPQGRELSEEFPPSGSFAATSPATTAEELGTPPPLLYLELY